MQTIYFFQKEITMNKELYFKRRAKLKTQRDALISKANTEKKMFPDEVYQIDSQMSKLAEEYEEEA